MVLPIVTTILAMQGRGCAGLLSGRPMGTGLLCWLTVLPASVANHLGHARFRFWQPPLQKLDRAFISLSSVLACWGMSQSLLFTGAGALLGMAIVFMLLAAPRHIRDDENLITGCVGGLVVYALSGMALFRDGLDPYFIPAAFCLFSGAAVFNFEVGSIWADAIWHVLLGGYGLFVALSAANFEEHLHGSCMGA